MWAIKPGHSHPTGPITLGEVWECPACCEVGMVPVNDGWRCLICETLVPLGADGVIEAHQIVPGNV